MDEAGPRPIAAEWYRQEDLPAALFRFVQDFIIRYLTKAGETPYLFFRDWLRYQYPELSAELIASAHSSLVLRKAIVTRSVLLSGDEVALIRLPGQEARTFKDSWRDDLDSSDENACPTGLPDYPNDFEEWILTHNKTKELNKMNQREIEAQKFASAARTHISAIYGAIQPQTNG